MSTKNPEAVPYHIANNQWLTTIDAILNQMKQPMNSNNANTKKKLRNDLKEVLNEALVTTQQQLLLNNSGKPTGVKADISGWVTATTDYDHKDVINKLPQASLVNIILKELLTEQENLAKKSKVVVSEGQILQAQSDSKDATKTHIELNSINHEGEEASRLIIDKETGDTTVYEKDLNTGEFVEVGVFKRYWTNVKDFCKNIWSWVINKSKAVVSWIKGLFSSPDDADVILAK